MATDTVVCKNCALDSKTPGITINAGTTSEYITGLAKTTKTPGFGPILAIVSVGMLFLFRKTRE